MCGICGISGYHEENKAILGLLLLDNESRGTDATGYAYSDKDKSVVHYRKQGIRASKFVDMYLGDLNSPLQARSIIGHTRAGTGGKASVNANNHPFETKHYILIHNGVLWNEWELNSTYKLKRKCKTDSEVIPLMMEKLGVVEGLEEIEGSMALAYYDMRDTSKMWLARNSALGSPINIGYLDDCLLFSSEEYPLKNIGCKNIFSMPDNMIYGIVGNEIVDIKTFKGKNTYYRGNRWNDYSYDYGSYDDVVCYDQDGRMSYDYNPKHDNLYQYEVVTHNGVRYKYCKETYSLMPIGHVTESYYDKPSPVTTLVRAKDGTFETQTEGDDYAATI